MKTRTLDAPNRRTFLSAADPDATLFVVETNGAAELAKVLQDNTTAMKVVGSQGLSVVVAAAVWPDIDKALASIVVPVPTSAVRAAATPTGWRGPHIKRIQAKLASGLADPIIVEALADVKQDNLMANIEELSEIHTRHSETADALRAQGLIEAKLMQLGYQISTFNFRTGYSSNVIATLPGTKFPDQYVIAGAHYDSRTTPATDKVGRAPGADDNGSGSAHILEIARVISESKIAFEYSVHLALFSGEEQGLLGSRAWAKELADTGVQVVAMFNSDMMGWKLPGTVPTLGMKDRYIADWLLNIANGLAEQYVPEIKVGSSSSCCSDHQSFTENGFPAIGYFENEGSASDYPHYHKSTDLPEFVDAENMQLVSKACLSTLMTFAVPDKDATAAQREAAAPPAVEA